MTEENGKSPFQTTRNATTQRIFDRTISISTIAVIVGMFTGAILWIFSAYLENQRQIYALQTQDVKFASNLETLQRDLLLMKQLIIDTRGDQKETDSAIRKTLEALLEDLRKNREDMYRMFGDRNPRPRGGLSAPSYRSDCWPTPGFRPSDNWPPTQSITTVAKQCTPGNGFF